jgi:hypothetical protein
VRVEFESARAELRHGTAVARKQAISEAACAVESAMKVLLHETGTRFNQNGTAQKLFDCLTDAGIVPSRMERLVLAPALVRNKAAAHGAGHVPHDPSQVEAEAVVASAAGVIAYIGRLLPASV